MIEFKEDKKLLLAKSSWIDYVRHYYFADGIDDLDDLETKERVNNFTRTINEGLSLNKNDWINFLIDQGWSKDENDINDTWFKNNPDFTDVNLYLDGKPIEDKYQSIGTNNADYFVQEEND